MLGKRYERDGLWILFVRGSCQNSWAQVEKGRKDSDQISVLEDLWVDYATKLLYDNA